MEITLRVAELLQRLAHGVDQLDWDAVRPLFAERARIDYTSLDGGDPVELAREDLIGAWSAMLPGFDATEHMIAWPLVTRRGELWHVRSQVMAWHRIGGGAQPSIWEIGGRYDHLLRDREGRLEIVAMTLEVAWQRGDDLRPRAAERAKRGEGR
ncbi:nuclear transport factor 2 family protein [Sandaracinus amylolyticus]|uniref:nuclear transport factor 2 family protein n=1 Tax=Sandaracinus amylolyticus TaxID=927083 RepID=UPI001F2D0967|nr:nuclear transport factor 2 family protein [Sandaracinus amylolyticus]UJR82155.1 SnoaL-like domain-containing protein [Sandaracinus amylolyticus]